METILSRFVAFLYTEQLTGATVKNYLSAVRHAQIALEQNAPTRVCGEGTKKKHIHHKAHSFTDYSRYLTPSKRGMAVMAESKGCLHAVGCCDNVLLRLSP